MGHKQTSFTTSEKIQPNQEIIVSLIEREFEGTKFVKELQRLGFDSSIYTPDLCNIITRLMGIQTKEDDLWEWYFNRLDEHTDNFAFQNKKQLRHEAYLFYLELVDYAC